MSEQKQTVVSFRVDQHLAEILNELPDKSAFIREAILRRFHTICPFCGGRGVLPQILAEWLKRHTPDYEAVECTCCHYAYPAEMVRSQAPTGDPEPFVCPHCEEHNHGH
jgi:hypothetical protein